MRAVTKLPGRSIKSECPSVPVDQIGSVLQFWLRRLLLLPLLEPRPRGPSPFSLMNSTPESSNAHLKGCSGGVGGSRRTVSHPRLSQLATEPSQRSIFRKTTPRKVIGSPWINGAGSGFLRVASAAGPWVAEKSSESHVVLARQGADSIS